MKRILLFLILALLCLTACTQSQEKRDIRVAVIDTGFSTRAIPEERIDEGANYLIPEGSTEDTFGHGTAVASVILKYSENAILIPLVSNVYDKGKVSFVDSETFGRMIRDAIDVYECDIINISSGLVLDKKDVREAVEYAEEKGVLIVASAGNDYKENPGQVYFPAAYGTALAVGSLNADGTEIADFSQRGSWIDVYAIGENVEASTLSGAKTYEKGASMAAARVTAAAVEILEKDSSLTPEELREILVSKAEDYNGKAGEVK